MDNAPSADADTPSVTHVATVDGCFGSVNWSAGEGLYNIMPRLKRDVLLDMTANKVIGPFFADTTDRLLAQVGCDTPSASLNTDWSFETREFGCEHVGQVFWAIGQGLWDALPADQRQSLLAVVQDTTLLFFHARVIKPLYAYSAKKLMP